MVALEEQLATNIRQDLVDALRQALQAKLYAKTVDRTVAVDEPDRGEDPTEWTSLPVITRRQWTEILFEVLDEPLPPADDSTAEVRTPATVLVWAFCPRCKLPAAIRLHVEPVLTIDSNGSSLKLKASSKATYHVCGQQTLRSITPDVAEGQQELLPDDEEDEGEDDAPEVLLPRIDGISAVPAVDDTPKAIEDDAAGDPPVDVVKSCGFLVEDEHGGQYCGLPAGHAGDHDPDVLPF